MKIPAIKKVTVVGANIVYEHNVDGVTEILDKSLEYESSFIGVIWVIKNESLSTELINAPLIIEHFK